jgi:para-nitrobenzyl esterase
MGVNVRFTSLLLFLLAAACSSPASSSPDAEQPPAPETPPDPLVVTTKNGPVRGAPDGATTSFKRIPFAAPPVGDLRFRPPAPAAPWTDVRDATAFSPQCVQVDYETRAPIGKEDCLYLNVWSPSDRTGAPLPVLFWIHGGDNVIGSASEAYYEAHQLAEKAHVVVVTINYRLGAFGWLAHPAFANESPHQSSGNYGLLDQIAALEWTRDNIAAFGGDPSRVLVGGQSAGASNTCALVTSPLARGLFSRALMMSLACYVVEPAVVASTNDAVERALGCTTGDIAACMRSKSAHDLALVPGASLLRTNEVADYYEVIDGWALPAAPESVLAQGRHMHVPMIVGTTRDEYSALLPLVVPYPPSTPEGYQAELEKMFGQEIATKVAAEYPLEKYGTPYNALSAVVSDEVMNCPSRRAARAATKTQSEPVYRYVFGQAPKSGPYAVYGAPHGIDVDFLFHTFTAAPPTDEEAAVADTFIAFVGRFAATGSVDAVWPAYGANDAFLRLETPLSTGEGWRNAECDFWELLN